MRVVRQSFPLVSALALLAVAPTIAPASNGGSGSGSSNSGSGNSNSGSSNGTTVIKTATTTVTGVVGNGANGAVSAPGQGLLPDHAVILIKPKKTDDTTSSETPSADTTGDGAATPADPAADGSVPVVGKRLGVTPEGEVRVKAPGGDWIDLADAATVPTGTVVDARAGTISLSAAVDADGTQQSAAFAGAVFRVEQASSTVPMTKLVLGGGDFKTCPKFASKSVRPFSAFAAKAKKPVRSLFGSGHGHFRTQGRFAAATVRGTIWQTDDYCDRTVITVKRGLVAVRDLHTGRSVEVPAGHTKTIRRR